MIFLIFIALVQIELIILFLIAIATSGINLRNYQENQIIKIVQNYIKTSNAQKEIVHMI